MSSSYRHIPDESHHSNDERHSTGGEPKDTLLAATVDDAGHGCA